MHIVDLSVGIGPETFSPPSVNKRIALTTVHKGPGYWQSSFVDMSLHTGSHADFPLHVIAGGDSAGDIALARLCGPGVLVDLGELAPEAPITLRDMETRGTLIQPGDLVLVRTGWAEAMWGRFPDYYLRSPFCEPEACQWIVDRGAKAVAFDCFAEYSARLPDFTPADFMIHKIILEGGAILMQHLTGLSQLPRDRHFQFFGACLKFHGAEGAPARFFAVVDDD